MRTLIIGALAVTMAGCSNRMPPHANTASDANGVTCSETAAAQPLELVPVIYESHSAIVKIHARHRGKAQTAVVGSRSACPLHRRHLRRPHTRPPPIPVRRTRESRIHIPEAAPSRAPRPLTIQQQVEAATAVAERMRRRRPSPRRPANPTPGWPWSWRVRRSSRSPISAEKPLRSTTGRLHPGTRSGSQWWPRGRRGSN